MGTSTISRPVLIVKEQSVGEIMAPYASGGIVLFLRNTARRPAGRPADSPTGVNHMYHALNLLDRKYRRLRVQHKTWVACSSV